MKYTYQSLATQLSAATARGRTSKKLCNNTYIEPRGDAIAIRLHDTDILTFKPDGSCVVSSGGWKTHTTKDRINTLCAPLRLYQARGMWSWSTGDPFSDGDVISEDGALLRPIKSQDDAKKELALRKSVTKYAKLYEKNLPLELPSGGDCWYCHLVSEDGKEWGGTDHLISHIEEGYVVPSLAFKAMKECGWTDMLMASAFGKGVGIYVVRGILSRAVRKYMCRRLGLAY